MHDRAKPLSALLRRVGLGRHRARRAAASMSRRPRIAASLTGLVAALLLLAYLPAIATPTTAAETLRLGVTRNGASLEIRTLDSWFAKPHVVPAGAIERLLSVFYTLECYVNEDCVDLKAPDEPNPTLMPPEDLAAVLEEEGERLLGPFADRIAAARTLSFRIDRSLLKLPLDLLHLRGKPLFLTHRISYTVGRLGWRGPGRPAPSWAGLLISDESTDPQRAVLAIAQSFPASRQFDDAEIELDKLREMQPVDFVAVSGHGLVDGSGSGFVWLANRQRLDPDSLAALRPKLVYYDSCNLGLSTAHLNALTGAGTSYAVAPILSNEAGDSSTATIEIFFSELARGTDPVEALFLARSELYERYAANDVRTRLWRAFPFRVYRLN